MLVWMAMRMPGLTGQGLHVPIPASPPEVDIRPALVVFPAGTADAIFSAYFIRDCLYAMSCVILLLIKDAAPSRSVGV